MRIGLIADIHSNLPALDAMLRALANVDMLVCAGDLVGYYNSPNEVCALIRDKAQFVVRGNHEDLLSDTSPQAVDDMYTDWTRSVLAADNLRWLTSLPEESEFRIDEALVHVRHTVKSGEYVYPGSPLLSRIHLGFSELMVIGHTHHPMMEHCGAGTVVNPGSVGQPRDLDPRPSFAVLETNTGEVVFGRTEYDIQHLQSELRSLKWDEALINRLQLAWPATISPLAQKK